MRKMYSKKQIEGMIEDDKNIISQIKVEYDKGNDITNFIFPNGIIPLSITLNNNDLFFKNLQIVNQDGNLVEGYTFDDLSNIEGNITLSLVGDLSNQIINGIAYFRFYGIFRFPIENTYKIFF